jgi:hypothetical protein
MKIEVDVVRADQSWEFDKKCYQNYLVISVFGAEVRVPCSEDQLVRAISEISGGPPPSGSYAEAELLHQAGRATDEFVDEDKPVAAPTTFLSAQEEEQVPFSPALHPQQAALPLEQQSALQPRRLAPLVRGDDVGIQPG